MSMPLSSDASANRHWRRSPSPGYPNSLRNSPEEPPSSNVVTTADMSMLVLLRFSPRSSADSPVPPPMAVTRIVLSVPFKFAIGQVFYLSVNERSEVCFGNIVCSRWCSALDLTEQSGNDFNSWSTERLPNSS